MDLLTPAQQRELERQEQAYQRGSRAVIYTGTAFDIINADGTYQTQNEPVDDETKLITVVTVSAGQFFPPAPLYKPDGTPVVEIDPNKMVTAEEAAAIVEAHRKYRMSVNPPPQFRQREDETPQEQPRDGTVLAASFNDEPDRRLSPELARELEDFENERTQFHGLSTDTTPSERSAYGHGPTIRYDPRTGTYRDVEPNEAQPMVQAPVVKGDKF